MSVGQRPSGMLNNLIIMFVIGTVCGLVEGAIYAWALDATFLDVVLVGGVIGAIIGALAGLLPFLASSTANAAAGAYMMGGMVSMLAVLAAILGVALGLIRRLV